MMEILLGRRRRGGSGGGSVIRMMFSLSTQLLDLPRLNVESIILEIRTRNPSVLLRVDETALNFSRMPINGTLPFNRSSCLSLCVLNGSN